MKYGVGGGENGDGHVLFTVVPGILYALPCPVLATDVVERSKQVLNTYIRLNFSSLFLSRHPALTNTCYERERLLKSNRFLPAALLFGAVSRVLIAPGSRALVIVSAE